MGELSELVPLVEGILGDRVMKSRIRDSGFGIQLLDPSGRRMRHSRSGGLVSSRLFRLAAVWLGLTLAAAEAGAQVVTPPAAEPAVIADTVRAAPPIAPPDVADPAELLADEPTEAEELAADTVGGRPPLDAATDSIMQYLRSLPGFTVTEYEGNSALYRTEDGTLRLMGDALVVSADQTLDADTIVVYDKEQYVEAYGSPHVKGAGTAEGAQELNAERLFYDLRTRRARAIGARTEVTESATWFVTGDMLTEGTNTLFVEHGHFTSCDLAIPHYHFETGQILVHRGKVLVATSAKLYFGNVPVMWLPFVVQNLEKGRRSGLLTPRFGINDIVRSSSGYNRQITDIGYYWAINQYMGAQTSINWRSGAYTSMQSRLEFNWRKQFLSGGVTSERFWESSGGKHLNLNSQANWRPDEVTSLAFSAGYASSSAFVRQSSYDPRAVTQDLNSSLSVNRTFGWGQVSLGGTRRQTISNGDVSTTLPNFSIVRKAITLFPSATPESAHWYNGITINLGSLTGTRSSTNISDNTTTRQQDRENSSLRASPSITIGNITVAASGDFQQTKLSAASGIDSNNQAFDLRGSSQDDASWSASTGYRLALFGSTSISPNISLNQVVRRDTLTAGKFLTGPTRLNFGASMATDLYGFFPGFGNFSTIRHRLSPSFSYSYAPEAKQSAQQELVFGKVGGRTQSRINFGVNQTFEAKLRNPRPPEDPVLVIDTITGDTIQQTPTSGTPGEPERVTLLSLTTSAFDYDFIQAREEGTGFLTSQVSNTINSDFLRGLSIQTRHELFDRSELNPGLPGNQGKLGRFAPQLAALSTSFELGPRTAIIQWFQRRFFGGGSAGDSLSTSAQTTPRTPQGNLLTSGNTGAFAGNQQTAGGPWRASIAYSFDRPSRNFETTDFVTDNRAAQTLQGNLFFQLSPNWSVNWNTNYSITDSEFAFHRLAFQRDLHEWQAHFDFYQTPNGNTGFEFYVQLIHNTDLKFDYSERNLGVDRQR